MAIANCDFKCYRDFKIDESRSLYIRDDQQVSTCTSAMAMAVELGVAEFSRLERIMFLWLDFCALIPLFRSYQFNALKTRIMPALIEKIEVANRLVRENYYCLRKNIDYLSEAKIVCLGERHTEKIHKKNNGAMIDELIGKSNSDVILVEALQENVHLSKQAKYVTKSIARNGWDIRGEDSLKEFKLLTFMPYAISTMLVTVLCMGLGSIYSGNHMSFLSPSYREIIAGGLMLLSVNAVRNLRKALKENQMTIANEFLSSNQNMCKIIEKNLEHRKIYVIGGWSHFIRPLPCLGQKGVQGVRELHEYLKDMKYVILIPKSELS